MSRLSSQTRYFLLSYAHPAPDPENAADDADHWERTLFNDLNRHVSALATTASGISPGWYDQKIPLGMDWKLAFTEALESAQVFVPLYSPGYFARARSGREWEGFFQRMLQSRPADPLERFLPILWAPLRGHSHPPGLSSAKELGEGFPDYLDFGLKFLLRLRRYRDSYEGIVARLARRIVDLAESAPLSPSPVPDLDQVVSRFKPDSESLPFGVTVAAAPRDSLPPDAPLEDYGKDGSQWSPYQGDSRPLAFYAADQAERLDFSAPVTSVGAVPRLPVHHPGVVLIDPWFVSTDDGAATLTTLVTDLKPWVLPVLVDAGPPDPRKAEFIARTRDILSTAQTVGSEPALAAREGVRSLQDFISLMPRLVAEAERRYLRYSSHPRPRQPRLRLVGDILAEDTDARRRTDD